MNNKTWISIGAVALLSLALTGAECAAELVEMYVGIDNRAAPFAAPPADGGGTYPDNPNFGRLTLLYQHGNHYHAIGNYRYTGPAAAPMLQDTSGNNRLPEIGSLLPPLTLVPGSGAYAGKHVTQYVVGQDFSNLEIRNAHELDNAGVAEDVLFHSSSERWSAPFAGADVHLKLLSVSSPYLSVGSPTDPDALGVGEEVHLGEGDEFFSFTPVLWVDSAAPVGNYWAEFQLEDETGTFGSSGRFFIDVAQVTSRVPEPAALLGAIGLAGLLVVRRLRF